MSGAPIDRKTDRNGAPKIDQDPARKTDGNGAAMTAMEYYEGTAEITQNNDNKFMAVCGGETAAMKYVAKGAQLTERNENNVKMMVVGLKGEEVTKAAEVFKDIAGSNIHIVIKINGEEPFDRKLPATKTVGDVILLMGKQYKKFFTIKRNGSELKEDMTLAEAAHTGSTVNWIAEV